MSNRSIIAAKAAKKDEFYTQYSDIEREINAYLKHSPNTFRNKTVLCPCDDYKRSNFTRYFKDNFHKLGLKRLISTCISQESQNGMFFSPTKLHGQYFNMTTDTINTGTLAGTGDFRSQELRWLRNEANIIVTNPPFSLFREFITWLINGNKKFLVLGNMNAITYKKIFLLIKENKMWLGTSAPNVFEMPDSYLLIGNAFKNEEKQYAKLCNITWFTNLEHGQRHQPLTLMTMEENKRLNRHKKIREYGYVHYDNYNAIDIPYTDAIPSDYNGIMGVPVSFMCKYCPEQFEIIGATESEGKGLSNGVWDASSKEDHPLRNGTSVYKRIFIRRRQ